MSSERNSQSTLDWRTLDLSGKTAIEASAGTGKTYTLVLLVMRLLLERELAPGAILLATFTEAATLELRARVSERLKLAYFAALSPSDPKRKAAAPSPMASDDPLAHYLNARWQNDSPRSKSNVRQRDEKILERALLQMDDMPIRTLHGLCLQLSSSFELVPGNLDAAIEDGDALTEAALDDAFRRRFADVKVLPEAQLDALDERFLSALSAGVKRVLKCGRITLRPAVSVDAARYRKARMALFRSQFRKDLREILAQPPEQWQLRIDARRAIENLLRTLNQGSERQLPKSSLAVFLQPQLAQKKSAGRSILASPAMAQLCHFAQLHNIALRSEFATLLNTLVDEVRLRRSTALAARGGVSFDSMIEVLAERLAPLHLAESGEFSGRAAFRLANVIHQRYPVALIDEFQDTDSQQWAILQAIYGTRGGLILVGDPKQSIYRFRGSDVHTFVRATKACERYFLQHNYRASAPLVAALNGFYRTVARPFQSVDISYYTAQVGRVDNVGSNAGAFANSWVNDKPLCFIEVTDAQLRYSAADACLRTACVDIKNLAAAHAAGPSVALLLTSNKQVRMAQEYLRELGVAVSASASLGVYQSEAAQVLQCVLYALAVPSDLTRARAARIALRLETIEQVSTLDEPALFRWIEHYLAQMLARGIGYVCLSLAIDRKCNAANRIDDEFADAQFTRDANHLAELLALDEQALLESQPSTRLNGADYAQAMWHNLRRHIEQPNHNTESAERRRIAAGVRVQVMTVHKAKGLEFDVVYLPTLGFAKASDSNLAIIPGVHGLEADAGSTDFENAIQVEADEVLAELLRLQYVALTRAKQAVNVYFADVAVKDRSALGWHLAQITANRRVEQTQESSAELAWEDQINAAPARVEVALKPWRTGLALLLEQQNVGYLMREVPDFAPLTVTEITRATGDFAVSQRKPLPALRPPQRRISFSSMTQNELNSDAVSVVENDFSHANAALDAETVNAEMPTLEVVRASDYSHPEILALEKFRGPNFGLALHTLFEDALSARLALGTDHVITRLGEFGLAADTESAHAIYTLVRRNWSSALVAADNLPALQLSDLNAANCIAELGFQLPVHGLDYRAVAELGPQFGLPLLLLPEQGMGRVNGMLIGFIDLVFQREGKFYLLDYKSNWLGANLQDYRGAALDAAMAQHHYHLQHLLYALALHRYLKQNLAEYDFETHFGGAHYLFVRAFGLAAPGIIDAGHFRYCAPKALIEALDRLFLGLDQQN